MGNVKIFLKFFVVVIVLSTLFQVIFMMSNISMTCVWFFLITLSGSFRGKLEDKLDIYFFL